MREIERAALYVEALLSNPDPEAARSALAALALELERLRMTQRHLRALLRATRDEPTRYRGQEG